MIDTLRKLWQRNMEVLFKLQKRKGTQFKTMHLSFSTLSPLFPTKLKSPILSNPFTCVLFSERIVVSMFVSDSKEPYREMEGIIELSFSALYFTNEEDLSVSTFFSRRLHFSRKFSNILKKIRLLFLLRKLNVLIVLNLEKMVNSLLLHYVEHATNLNL